jgi:hypothetical protein
MKWFRINFADPYEVLFLLPQVKCKKCGTEISKDSEFCSKCGKKFKWSLREKLLIKYISWHIKQDIKEQKLEYLKRKKNCKIHGLQNYLSLPKTNLITGEDHMDVCIVCLAKAMAEPCENPIEKKK